MFEERETALREGRSFMIANVEATLTRRISRTLLSAIALLALAAVLLTGCSVGGSGSATGATATGSTSGSVTTPTGVSGVKVVNASPSASTSSTPTAQTAAGATATATTSTAGTAPRSVADLVEQVNPAVVTVVNQQNFQGFSNSNATLQPAGSGTGFIISQDGYVVTNEHVVAGSQGLQVIFQNGDIVTAELVGSDVLTDLAVVKIPAANVTGTVPFGDSAALRVGEPVIAIGSALGEYTNTVTEGIVSGLNRQVGGGEGAQYDNMIQHDAPINPGNSGGPLLNLKGEVVGVNTLVVRQTDSGVPAEGLGFAIPSNSVQQITNALIKDGQILRPYLGIQYAMLTPQIATTQGINIQQGALVTDVPSGPAATAGVQANDVITKINGVTLNRNSSLRDVLFQYKPNETVELEIYRPSTGATLTLSVTLGTRPANP